MALKNSICLTFKLYKINETMNLQKHRKENLNVVPRT